MCKMIDAETDIWIARDAFVQWVFIVTVLKISINRFQDVQVTSHIGSSERSVKSLSP